MKTTVWYRDPHVLSAVVGCVMGIAMAHAGPKWTPDLLQIYSCLATLGIISARAQVGSALTLTKKEDA